MKKNSKGFTMVEIIAVVAILGILIMVTMPRLLSLVTSSKDEIYVQDAKKLIAQARYVMGKNSNEIEKPMAGNYIVLSLNYLGSTNFSSPPNGGSYLTEASFVVVKNVQKPDSDIEDFKYSAVLIESAKEGFYRGIKMSSEEELNTNSAKTLVTYFNDDDIVYIDEDAAINNSCEEERCTLSEEYINTYATDENMKSEEGTIVGKYNNIITKQDGEEVEVFSAPTFTARAISDSGSLYALGGNLYVVARDADNEVSDLKVCVKISKDSNDSYPDVNDSTYCKPYGSEESLDNGTYKLAFDLSNYDFSYDEREVAYFYIIVSDPEGNYSRKKIDYEVHKNTAPVINLFEIAKHKDESRNFNMPFVSLRGSFVDDMDDISKLKFCLVDSNKENDNRECTDYHDYNYYFNGNNKYYFKNEDGSNITKPDGSTHYLTLYVKDSNNLVTSQKATLGSNINKVDENDNHTYKIYKNQNPVITSFKLDSDMIKKDGYESGHDIKNVSVDITVDDDMTKVADLKLVIGKNGEISFSTYDSSSSPFKKYTFDGGYDGKDRSLTITVTDEFGATATATQVLKNIYKDQAPQVSFEVSSENIYRSRIFDKNGDEKIPIVPKPKDCINGTEGVCFKTTDYYCSKCKSNIANGIVEDGSYNVTIRSSIVDDLTTTSNLSACITTDKNGCSKDEDFKDNSASSFVNFSYEIPGSYDLAYKENKTVTIYLYVKDDNNPAVKAEKKYKLYKNVAPKVKAAENIIVSAGNGGLNIGSVNITMKDAITITDDFNDYNVDFCYLVKDKNYDENKKPGASEILNGNCTKISNDTLNSPRMPFEFKDENGVVLDYDSQRVYTMFRVTDGYGETANSNIVLYKLSANVPPDILDFTVESSAKNEDGTEKYKSIKFDYSFAVYDPEDSYTVCITTLADPDRCDYTTDEGKKNFKGIDDKNTPYKGGSDGTKKGEYKVENFDSSDLMWVPTFDDDKNLIKGKWKYSIKVDYFFQEYYKAKGIIGENGHKSETLLFVVADSKGAMDKWEYVYVPRYSCELHYNRDVIKHYEERREIDENSGLTSEQKEAEKAKIPMEIDILEESERTPVNLDDVRYENFSADIEGAVDYITPESCNGLCYENISDMSERNIGYTSISFPKSNDVKAFYRKIIKYTDKVVQNEKSEFSGVCDNGIFDSRYGCNQASCLDDGGNENNYLISLYLYNKNTKWTYQNMEDAFKVNRNLYKSICKESDKQNDILFSKNDYRIGSGANLCNGVEKSIVEDEEGKEVEIEYDYFREKCERSIVSEYDPDFNPEERDCEKEKQESEQRLPAECALNVIADDKGNVISQYYAYESPDFCNNINNYKNYIDKKLLQDYEKIKDLDLNELPEDERKEVSKIRKDYNDAVEIAKKTCLSKIPDIKNKCENKRDEIANQFDICEKNNADIKKQKEENDKKKEEYENKISSCKNSEKTKCISEIEGYSKIPVLNGMLNVSNKEQSDIEVLCDSRILDGNCAISNCEEEGLFCKRKFYKKINCTNEKLKSRSLQAICHGYFKLYRSKVVDKKVVIEDTGMRICPEVLSSKAYANKFSFSPSSPNDKDRYIKFFPSDYGGIINE